MARKDGYMSSEYQDAGKILDDNSDLDDDDEHSQLEFGFNIARTLGATTTYQHCPCQRAALFFPNITIESLLSKSEPSMRRVNFDPDVEAGTAAASIVPVTPQTPGPFAPQFEAVNPSFVRSETIKSQDQKYQAPEQKLTLLAVRLVVLEKAASGLGKLAFIWATVVLIGGLGGDMQEIDFWVVTGLLMTEGTRIFSRSQEVILKNAGSRISFLLDTMFVKSNRIGSTPSDTYQPNIVVSPQTSVHRRRRNFPEDETHDGAASNNSDTGDDDANLFHTRKWSPNNAPVVPCAHFFSVQNIGLFLHLLEVLSALVSIALSLLRLIQHNFNGEPKRRNLANAAYLFYAMILVEASIFLMERFYWVYMISWQNLLQQVTKKCKLTPNHLNMVEEFFYKVYSDCLTGHTFKGLDKDLVEFSMEKLQSDDAKDQQGGVTILSIFLTRKDQFAAESIRKIGSTPGAIERLLEMITWKDKNEREVRRAAAWIIKNLVNYVSNYYFKIASTAGAVEGVISLLSDDGIDQDDPTSVEVAHELKVLGLSTLLGLSKDPKICFTIGRSRGLIAKLVSFIEKEDIGCAEDELEFKIIQKSLELLEAIASTPGDAGIGLRTDIAKTIYVLRNLGAILEHGNKHPKLQSLAIDLLTSLALDGEIRESIGNSGAIILHLKILFLRDLEGSEEQGLDVAIKAGEALDLLALGSPKNCNRILGHRCYDHRHDDEFLEVIIEQLKKPKMRIRAAKILRSLYKHATDLEKEKISATLPVALKTAMESRAEDQEAALGLAAKVIENASETELKAVFENVNKQQLTEFAMELICKPASATGKLPRLRRYAVEFVRGVAQKDEWFAKRLKEKGIVEGLEKMLESVTDVENYHAFSGSMGLIPHSQPLGELIESTLCRLA